MYVKMYVFRQEMGRCNVYDNNLYVGKYLEVDKIKVRSDGILIQSFTFWTLSIVPTFYLKQGFGDWTVLQSSVVGLTQLCPIDRSGP
jgi:hypothetical protein